MTLRLLKDDVILLVVRMAQEGFQLAFRYENRDGLSELFGQFFSL